MWELWMDDCGINGTCAGTPTLRAHYSDVGYRASGNNAQIGDVWIENWGNNRPSANGGASDGSIGTHYYDNFKVSGVGPIGFVGDGRRPAAPTNLRVQ